MCADRNSKSSGAAGALSGVLGDESARVDKSNSFTAPTFTISGALRASSEDLSLKSNWRTAVTSSRLPNSGAYVDGDGDGGDDDESDWLFPNFTDISSSYVDANSAVPIEERYAQATNRVIFLNAALQNAQTRARQTHSQVSRYKKLIESAVKNLLHNHPNFHQLVHQMQQISEEPTLQTHMTHHYTSDGSSSLSATAPSQSGATDSPRQCLLPLSMTSGFPSSGPSAPLPLPLTHRSSSDVVATFDSSSLAGTYRVEREHERYIQSKRRSASLHPYSPMPHNQQHHQQFSSSSSPKLRAQSPVHSNLHLFIQQSSPTQLPTYRPQAHVPVNQQRATMPLPTVSSIHHNQQVGSGIPHFQLQQLQAFGSPQLRGATPSSLSPSSGVSARGSESPRETNQTLPHSRSLPQINDFHSPGLPLSTATVAVSSSSTAVANVRALPPSGSTNAAPSRNSNSGLNGPMSGIGSRTLPLNSTSHLSSPSVALPLPSAPVIPLSVCASACQTCCSAPATAGACACVAKGICSVLAPLIAAEQLHSSEDGGSKTPQMTSGSLPRIASSPAFLQYSQSNSLSDQRALWSFIEAIRGNANAAACQSADKDVAAPLLTNDEAMQAVVVLYAAFLDKHTSVGSGHSVSSSSSASAASRSVSLASADHRDSSSPSAGVPTQSPINVNSFASVSVLRARLRLQRQVEKTLQDRLMKSERTLQRLESAHRDLLSSFQSVMKAKISAEDDVRRYEQLLAIQAHSPRTVNYKDGRPQTVSGNDSENLGSSDRKSDCPIPNPAPAQCGASAGFVAKCSSSSSSWDFWSYLSALHLLIAAVVLCATYWQKLLHSFRRSGHPSDLRRKWSPISVFLLK